MRRQLLIDHQTSLADYRLAGFQTISIGKRLFAWSGHLFLPGFVAGEESIVELSELIDQSGFERSIIQLYGVFGLAVCMDSSQRAYCWKLVSDHGGHFHFFYDARGASPEFLPLARNRGYRVEDFDKKAMLDFLAFGVNFESDTFIKSIHRTTSSSIISVDKTGTSTSEKPLELLEPASEEQLINSFEHLAVSLSGCQLSADVTGGMDSRVLVALLDNTGLSFELAVSGQETRDNVDITSARQVAASINRQLHVTGHSTRNLEQDFETILAGSDGQIDVRRMHRITKHTMDRIGRDVTVIMHGGGGEFFRDHYVIQDFPFYDHKKSDLGKYYDLRMAAIPPRDSYFTGDMLALKQSLRERTLVRMESYLADSNTRTYDRIFWYLRSPHFYGTVFSFYTRLGINVVAPFLDYRHVQHAMNIPAWSRFLGRWHKALISREHPRLAAIPTADGYTMSNEFKYQIINLFSLVTSQSRRILRKVSQRAFGKSNFYATGFAVADHPDYMATIRTSAIFQRSIKALKKTGFLSDDLAESEVHDIHMGRLITLGYVVRALSQSKTSDARLTAVPQLERSA